MESRPWYKKVTQYFRRRDQVTPTISVHEYPLSDPKPAPRVVKVKVKRKARYRPAPLSNDPRFNHALRRVKCIDVDTRGMTCDWIAFWIWVIILVVVVIATICGW